MLQDDKAPHAAAVQDVGHSESVTKTQAVVLAIWADVLERPNLRPSDSFFDLGGDSMLMMMILFRIHEELGVELPPGVLFESPTALQCAELVEKTRLDTLNQSELQANDPRNDVDEGVI